jgi:signal transduction histidine kinase
MTVESQPSRFSQMLRAELAAAHPAAPPREVKCGETIFQEGDPGDGLYVILEGSVQISAIVGQSERRVLTQFGPGDFFGEMAVIDFEPRSASAVADKDTRLLFVSRDEMLRLMERQPALALALLREFTHRMREFNRQYVQEIIHADRIAMLGRFARSIVHDLKNPLGVIGLAADLSAAERATPAMRKEARERIHTQVDRMSHMLQELLRLTEGGKLSALEPTSLREYFAGVLDEVRDEMEARRVTLEAAAAPDVRLPLNRARLVHVFFNLFNNAADFLKNGGKIMIRFEETSRDVLVEVEDTGPGIPPEVARKLFTPFFTHGKPNGTGLGLTICKNIVEDHAGKSGRARSRTGARSSASRCRCRSGEGRTRGGEDSFAARARGQARSGFTTVPWMSVRRNSRP